MKKTNPKNGFTLMELLTVIAIIAILAAIIFPAMNSVKDRANRSKCMTNLQQLAVGVQAFKEDNRSYPDVMGPVVKDSGSGVMDFDYATGSNLFNEYVKSPDAFHCPSSNVESKTAYAEYATGSDKAVSVYAYNSYDFRVWGGDTNGKISGDKIDIHYTTRWANTVDDVSQFSAYPPTEGDSADKKKEDYKRQLRFRTPPGDTVVTWCDYHTGSDYKGRAMVVFLDGHAADLPAKDVNDSRWRTLPK